MKIRWLWIAILVVVVILGVVAVALAAQRGGAAGGRMMGGGGMMGGGAMGGGGMMGGMGGMMGQGGMMMNCPMSGMMGLMGGGSMVALEGSIYVLSGGTLRQYDRNLNLRKEVEVTPSPASMQRMQQMMQSCPMMGQGMGPRAQAAPPTTPAPPRPATPPAHQQHHP